MEEQLYKEFYEVEERHWWFVGRQNIIKDLLRRRLRLPANANVLDVGCGTGAFLKALSSEFQAYGTDTSPLAIEYCKKRGLNNAYLCTLETFPHNQLKFDLITLLDVIEHIDDDIGILLRCKEHLKPKGYLLITVPAYQWLWSKHDEINHHKRRYVRSKLREIMEEAGFSVEMISYINSILFPLAFLERLTAKVLDISENSTLKVPPAFVNKALSLILSSESELLRLFPLPFGLSILGLARKVTNKKQH